MAFQTCMETDGGAGAAAALPDCIHGGMYDKRCYTDMEERKFETNT